MEGKRESTATHEFAGDGFWFALLLPAGANAPRFIYVCTTQQIPAHFTQATRGSFITPPSTHGTIGVRVSRCMVAFVREKEGAMGRKRRQKIQDGNTSTKVKSPPTRPAQPRYCILYEAHLATRHLHPFKGVLSGPETRMCPASTLPKNAPHQCTRDANAGDRQGDGRHDTSARARGGVYSRGEA